MNGGKVYWLDVHQATTIAAVRDVPETVRCRFGACFPPCRELILKYLPYPPDEVEPGTQSGVKCYTATHLRRDELNARPAAALRNRAGDFGLLDHKQRSRLVETIVSSCRGLDEESQQWIKSRLSELADLPPVLHAIFELQAVGCDPTVILLWVKMHSEVPTEREFQTKSEAWNVVKKRAAALAPQITQLARDIQALHNTGIDRGNFLALYIERVRKSSHLSTADDDIVEATVRTAETLPNTLHDYADNIASYANLDVDLSEAFARIRDFYLALLCVYSEILASGPKFSEVAQVIAFWDRAQSGSAAEVKQKYEAFAERNPEIIKRMAQFVRTYYFDNSGQRPHESFLDWSRQYWPF